MSSSHLSKKLSDILTKNEVITEEQLKKAVDIQRQKGGQLSRILIELGFITENDLVQMLSHTFKIPPINLSKISIDPEVVKIIPIQIARFYQTIAISLLKNQLTVVFADPLNVLALDEIRTLTGYEINAVLATEAEILQAIDMYYSGSASDDINRILDDISKTDIELITDRGVVDDQDTAELLKLVDEAPIIKITNKLLIDAVKYKASDLFIEPMEKTMRVRCRIDGILKEFKAPPSSMHQAIISRLKILSNLNIAEHRLPQDGRFKMKIDRQEISFRVSILPSSMGEKAVLRVLDKSGLTLELDKLGFESEDLDRMRSCLEQPHGMILVCGPTGSGKTTTLYSMLKQVNSIERNLVTVEDPIEYQLDGVNQVPVKEQLGLTFGAALRSILRQDPDIIMIGEIRDYETLDIAVKAALTGHLVFSTLHTNTACGSVVRMINMGIEPFLITASVIMMTSQRLLRCLCKSCRKSYKISPELVEQLGLQGQVVAESIFYKACGCSGCENTGYKGRVAITEVLLLNDSIKEAILSRATERVIGQLAAKNGMRTLRQDAIKKASEGFTTLEEVVRLTAAEPEESTEDYQE